MYILLGGFCLYILVLIWYYSNEHNYDHWDQSLEHTKSICFSLILTIFFPITFAYIVSQHIRKSKDKDYD